ncbi:MAG: hypothetical protein F7C33_06915 [Desulfurococcales archaeon]|nr:hypothetical protein [Desulfurococcales archaeon]
MRDDGVPRNTLAWYTCDMCGRKAYVYKCRYQGRELNLCPYCMVVLAGKKGFSCGHRIVKLASVSAYEDKWAKADLLASRLEQGLTAEGRRRSKSRKSSSRRGRGRRR